MKVHLLAFGAHPDDVELSCGGTILKMVKFGYKAGIIDLTEAELSTRGTVERRRMETGKSSKILDLSIRENLQISDGQIENNHINRLKVVNCIRKYQPEIILAPYYEDRHPDHVHTSNLISESNFYSGLSKIETGTNPYRAKNIIYYYQHLVDNPSFVVDITDEFEKKMEAVKAFESQFYNPESDEPETFISQKQFFDSLKTRGQYFGYQIGVEYGEPFFVKSIIKITNLYEIFS
ncbi:MAG TPA: bacillithiol biosynthesis deacetylase BshB1 [Caldithrix sp.]|nr:bacillithiol biosynthesis deacetylase BshB1 [Calditrichaceae bacterium]HEM48620.1 bacillithiol biosynthesis deacetylase BshB1 [Caldithrix sp.]